MVLLDTALTMAARQGFGVKSLNSYYAFSLYSLSASCPGSLVLKQDSVRLSNPCMIVQEIKNTPFKGCSLFLAARQGFEPQLKASKASVLPLDDLAIVPLLTNELGRICSGNKSQRTTTASGIVEFHWRRTPSPEVTMTASVVPFGRVRSIICSNTSAGE